MLKGKKVISFCLTRIQDSFTKDIIEQLHRIVKERGHILLVYATSSNLYWNSDTEKGEASVYDLVDMSVTDLLIVFSEKIDTKFFAQRVTERAKKAGVPVIIIGEPTKGCANVRYDYVEGFKDVVRHVIGGHGIRDVHLMGGVKDNPFSIERVDAFGDVLAEYGIEFDRDKMVSYGEFWSMPTEAACEELLKRDKLPRALVCCNDTMGITAVNFFKRRGIKVPDDIVVTGFDGIKEINFCEPKLTSCMCSPAELAKAVDSLAEDIFGGRDCKGTEVLVRPTLLTSESCGCEYKGGIVLTDYINDLDNTFYRFQEEYRGLNEITTRILKCADFDEASALILKYNDAIYDVDCILNKSCFDESADQMRYVSEKPFDDERTCFFSTDYNHKKPFVLQNGEYAPDFEKLIEGGMPVIFIALHLLSRPLGYLCFHYWNYDIQNYIKIPQLKSCISNAVASFINMRYQHYISLRIEEIYKTDTLTGLLNRNGFFREYTALVAGRKKDERISLAIADLDGLKYINDNYGHDEGDYAIHAAAQALKKAVPKDAVCARFGGDEIIAVYTENVSEMSVSERFEHIIENINSASMKPYRISASIGIHTDSTTAISRFEELLKKADKLMYAQKKIHHEKMNNN